MDALRLDDATAQPRTRDEVRALFDRHGLAVSDWAVAHGYLPHDVRKVLNGAWLGRRGVAHKIAVDLGLKAPPPVSGSQVAA